MKQNVDHLAERLRELPLEHPQPAVITARVLEAMGSPARIRSVVSHGRRHLFLRHGPVLAALTLLAALPLTWAAMYFSPAAAATLADASGAVGFSPEILRNFALGSGSGVTSQNSTATASGHEVRLVGAYSDPIRTVILVQVTPPAFASSVRLTDQFGTVYRLNNAEGHLDSGDEALSFEPATWLASFNGVRFTLSIDRMSHLSGDLVAGAWTVRGVVLPKAGATVPAPAPGSIGSGTASFVDVRHVGRLVSIRVEVRGVPQSSQWNLQMDRISGSPPNRMELLSGSSGDLTKIQAIFNDVGAGTYLVTLSLSGVGTLQRTLVVS